jgi:hypothetical protein
VITPTNVQSSQPAIKAAAAEIVRNAGVDTFAELHKVKDSHAGVCI